MFRRGKKSKRILIDLAAGLPADLDWQLWLGGDGTTRAACEHAVAARRLGPAGEISWVAARSLPALQAADIRRHASQTESLSNFVIEARLTAFRRRLRCPGISECFPPGETGFVLSRGDRDGFRCAIRTIGSRHSGRA